MSPGTQSGLKAIGVSGQKCRQNGFPMAFVYRPYVGEYKNRL